MKKTVTVDGNQLRRLLARAGGCVDVLYEKLLVDRSEKAHERAQLARRVYQELDRFYVKHHLARFTPKRTRKAAR